MEIKIYPFKCPACGADLPITDFSRKVIFCSYCGTRLIIESDDDLAGAAVESNKEKGSSAGQATRSNINNGNSNGQTDKSIKGEYKSPKKKAESDWDGWDGWDEEESTGLEYFEDDPPEATGVQKLKGWAVDMLKEVLETPTTEERTYPSREKQPMKKQVQPVERVRPPRIAINPGTEHFTTVEAAFRSKGFTNIRCEPLYDLRRGILYKPGTVKSVTINGEDVIYGFKKYDSDAIVVILYHSFYNR